jgi:hypothetical protein
MISAYQAFGNGITLQNNTAPALCVQLQVPNPGYYVVFGRLVVTNLSGSSLNATALLSTHDGTNNLDGVNNVRIPPGADTCISLMQRLLVTAANANEIVDIRCTASGTPSSSGFAAVSAPNLIAISVDALA